MDDDHQQYQNESIRTEQSPPRKIQKRTNQDVTSGLSVSSANQVIQNSVSKTSVTSITTLAFQKQHGLQKRCFQTSALECKLRNIGNIFAFQSLEPNNPKIVFTNRALFTDANVDYIAGIRNERNRRKTYYHLFFEHCQQEESELEQDPQTKSIRIKLSPVFGMLRLKPCFKISDVCFYDSTPDTCRTIISVGNGIYDITMSKVSGSNLKTRSNEVWLQDDQIAHSCASNCASQRVAFALDNGGLIYSWDEVMKKLTDTYTEKEHLISTVFDYSGEIVYGGSTSGNIFCNDLRCDPGRKYVYNIKLKPQIGALHVLKNDNQLLVSGGSNQLMTLDLRTRRPILNFEGHVNDNKKIKFSIDEDLRVLCSMGQDTRTRLWNLDSGLLVTTIEPPVQMFNGRIPSAVFKHNWGNKLKLPTVVIGSGRHMFIYHV